VNTPLFLFPFLGLSENEIQFGDRRVATSAGRICKVLAAIRRKNTADAAQTRHKETSE
jgi:hypothetical protein